jgi:hypothetical protein
MSKTSPDDTAKGLLPGITRGDEEIFSAQASLAR